MNALSRKFFSGMFAVCIACQPLTLHAEDIDIFVGDSAGAAGSPNVLFVLDNTSNWSRQSQKWPGGEQQGQSEVDAIKSVVNSLNFTVNPMNIGLMEFVTGGSANDNGGYVRAAVMPMNEPANLTYLTDQLTAISVGITTPAEKRNSGTAYGNLLADVYNYFAGENQSQGGTGTPATLADGDGYTTEYSKFKSPLSCDTVCAKNFVIFITNPDASGPTHDDSPFTPGNTTQLAALGGNTAQLALPNFSSAATIDSAIVGTTSSCLSAATCTAAAGTSANNTSFVSTYAPSLAAACADTSVYSNGCSCGTAQAGVADCTAGTDRYTVKKTIPAGTVVSSWTTNDCYGSVATPGSTAPSGFPTSNGSNKETSSCPAGTSNYFSAKTLITANGSCKNKYVYTVQCKQIADTTTDLGYTNSCYAPGACSTADYAAQCTSPATCACGTPTITTGTTCSSNTSLYSVLGNNATITNTPTGTSTTDSAPYNADEWGRFFYQKGVKFPTCDAQSISTYTLDVYNAQPNAKHTSLMMSMAKAGGGKYFNATNKQALINALKQIFAEIVSVNSTFASASLPVNATNRAQNENQVFIGMFRPDQETKPRWFGNLKRYQIIKMPNGVDYDIGDVTGKYALNTQTGFLDDCAISWWTTDSPFDPGDLTKGYYWADQTVKPDPASNCSTVASSMVYSDSPDGPTVEKGAVAEVLRKGNNPPTTNGTPTWTPNRTMYTTTTLSSTTLDALSGAPNLSATQRSWVAGADTENEDGDAGATSLTETRGSIHGDVVHSRPVPVNYGGTTGVVIYYGANDGAFRAVNAETGKEIWSFVPYEFAQSTFVDRLRTNSPLIRYPSTDLSITPTPQYKTYGWDGSVGLTQDINNSKIWIYPTMRRGGQMVYALDVTNHATPTIKWKAGCYAGTCTDADFANMGQTWSAPFVAWVKGYTTEKVAFFGGGYDTCEDADTATPTCPTASYAGSKQVYTVDAGSGTLLKKFATDRSVTADIKLVDVNADGKADYAYVADVGGNLYRIDLVDYASGAYTERDESEWTIRKIATAGGGRKFLFAPATYAMGSVGKVYVAIGSGDREHPLASNYPYNNVTNRFYVYVDDLSKLSGAADDLNNTTTMNDATVDLGCNSIEALTTSTTLKGWFMDLNQYGQGEQTVTTPLILGGLVAFSTNRPIPPAAGSCSSALGSARGYWVSLTSGSGAIGAGSNSCDGSRSMEFAGGGLPPSPVTGVVPVDGKPVTVVIGAAPLSGTGVATPISGQPKRANPDQTRKRAYWKTQGVD